MVEVICLEKHRLLSKMKSQFLEDGVEDIGDVDGRMSDGLERELNVDVASSLSCY